MYSPLVLTNHPAAATAWPAWLFFIWSPSTLTAGEGADKDVGFESSGCCTPFEAGAGLGLLSEAKT